MYNVFMYLCKVEYMANTFMYTTLTLNYKKLMHIMLHSTIIEH